MTKILTPEVRAWFYGVSVAVIALLVALGLLDADLDDTILNLLAAVLGLGNASLATAYRPTRVPGDEPLSAPADEDDEPVVVVIPDTGE